MFYRVHCRLRACRFFHWVLHYKEVGYIIFGIGVLLTLATYILREDMKKTHVKLTQQYHNVHEIVFAIACISDQECPAKVRD